MLYFDFFQILHLNGEQDELGNTKLWFNYNKNLDNKQIVDYSNAK